MTRSQHPHGPAVVRCGTGYAPWVAICEHLVSDSLPHDQWVGFPPPADSCRETDADWVCLACYRLIHNMAAGAPTLPPPSPAHHCLHCVSLLKAKAGFVRDRFGNLRQPVDPFPIPQLWIPLSDNRHPVCGLPHNTHYPAILLHPSPQSADSYRIAAHSSMPSEPVTSVSQLLTFLFTCHSLGLSLLLPPHPYRPGNPLVEIEPAHPDQNLQLPFSFLTFFP